MKTYQTLQQIAQDAINIQNASNLQAILGVWASMQTLIREDTVSRRTGYERHPINILMASKVASLMQVNVSSIGVITSIDNRDLFSSSYKWAEEVSRG